MSPESRPNIPAGYTVRHPTRDDLPAIAAMTAAADLHDTGAIDFTPATFDLEWASARFDPAQDAWLVETSDGQAAAYMALSRRPNIPPEGAGWIHPDHRGRGIGTLVFDLAEARVHEIIDTSDEHIPRVAVQWSNHAQREFGRFLETRGYAVTRSFWRMSTMLGDEEPAAPEWPAGIEVRTMRPGVDDLAVHTTVTTAFRDHWGSSPLPFEEWRVARMGLRFFDPELWLLAWSGDQIVGAALNTDEDGEAWVSTLGVLREARGKGLGRALLIESFRTFHRRGQRHVMLGVDAENLTGATRLYEGAGMVVDRQYDHWERSL